ncbi:MAG TPA: hypothetical protein VNM91_08995, partial [Dehalococcoidia bacterium]|nr:hypothetical protein [Dehalococcoidia bacterium]
DKLIEQATIEFPPVMVESEIDRMLHDQGVHPEHEEDMARYLSMIGRTAEELHEELKPIAEARIRRSLVLAQAAIAEGIEVSEAEVDAELERMVAGAGPQGEQLRQVFGSETGRDTMRRNILTRKTLSRLVEIATEGKFGGQQAQPEAPAEAPPPAPAAAAADTTGETPAAEPEQEAAIAGEPAPEPEE